jgi:bacillaene synthase trans-acting acyltransferase
VIQGQDADRADADVHGERTRAPTPLSTVFMFSGQGSQYFQMGRDLFEHDRTFRDVMVHLDDLARPWAGTSVVEALYDDGHRKSDPFDRTLLTHPAIFMIEYALAQSLMHAGVCPDMVLGVSLGSFAAAAVAGFLGVDAALTAVMRQAIAIEDACEPGGMIAVLADPALFAEDFLSNHAELAAVNWSSHFVVSARRADLAAIESALRARHVVYQRLPVSFPFHSQWIDAAKAPFASSARSIVRTTGRLPLVCCDQAVVLTELPDEFFWHVVRHPIRFREAIARLEQQGARRYIDVGPSGTLATFLKYGLPAHSRSTVHAILTPYSFDQKNLAAVAAAVLTGAPPVVRHLVDRA